MLLKWRNYWLRVKNCSKKAVSKELWDHNGSFQCLVLLAAYQAVSQDHALNAEQLQHYVLGHSSKLPETWKQPKSCPVCLRLLLRNTFKLCVSLNGLSANEKRCFSWTRTHRHRGKGLRGCEALSSAFCLCEVTQQSGATIDVCTGSSDDIIPRKKPTRPCLSEKWKQTRVLLADYWNVIFTVDTTCDGGTFLNGDVFTQLKVQWCKFTSLVTGFTPAEPQPLPLTAPASPAPSWPSSPSLSGSAASSRPPTPAPWSRTAPGLVSLLQPGSVGPEQSPKPGRMKNQPSPETPVGCSAPVTHGELVLCATTCWKCYNGRWS